MTTVRNLALSALITLTAMLVAVLVLTWDLYIYLDDVATMAATIGFVAAVLATYGTLFAVAVTAHDNR